MFITIHELETTETNFCIFLSFLLLQDPCSTAGHKSPSSKRRANWEILLKPTFLCWYVHVWSGYSLLNSQSLASIQQKVPFSAVEVWRDLTKKGSNFPRPHVTKPGPSFVPLCTSDYKGDHSAAFSRLLFTTLATLETDIHVRTNTLSLSSRTFFLATKWFLHWISFFADDFRIVHIWFISRGL